MKNKKYIPRALQKDLKARAREFPVVVVTGPRQSGKSTLLTQLFKNHMYVSLDDPLLRRMALEDPEIFLENHPAPLILDEIQYCPGLLPYIKIAVDRNRSLNGQYLLTGSQMFPLMQGVTESLAGRAVIYELLGFSLEEYPNRKTSYTAKSCFQILFEGSYPEVCIHRADPNAFYRSYIQSYLERDIRQIRAVHDLNIYQNFLELLAARCGSLLNINEISKECGVSATTIKNWLSVLETTRIVYQLRPYFKNVSKRVIKSPKIYFTDTGLLAYILKYPTPETLQHGPMAGAFFENYIVLECLKYKMNHDQRFDLFFFRDSNHNEADLVIDRGYEKIVCEAKFTKTPRREHVKTLAKILDVIGASQAYLITASASEMRVDSRVSLLPWWRINRLFQQP